MNRIMLTGIALLAFAATLYAQNTATVNQNGNAQLNTVTQTGSNNQTLIQQLTGTATVVNTSNVAAVTQQANPLGLETNQAFVNQLNGSDYNRAVIGQSGGSGNIGTIEQNGGNGYRNGGSGLLTTAPAGARAGLGNDARITQVGAGNDQTLIRQNAGTLGGSQANEAVIQQMGHQNVCTVIEQSNKSWENVARIDQGTLADGASGNNAVILQNDDSQKNRATVSQEGTGQVAEVRQTAVSGVNTTGVSQVGFGGVATVYQTDNSHDNRSTVNQLGTAAAAGATIYQTSASGFNQATVEQAGSVDAALINQSEQSKNNVAEVQQGAGGINNSAAITQTYSGIGGSYGTGSMATIQQNLTTAGGSNQAEVMQGFAGGISTETSLPVVSDKNQAGVGQEGDMNKTSLLQGGVSNQATVMQKGFSTLKGIDDGLTVNDVAGQIGNLNVLQVNQTGTLANPNTASVRQVGIGNSGTIGQSN